MIKNFYQIGSNFELSRVSNINKVAKKIRSSKYLITDVAFYIIIPLLLAVPLGLYLDHILKTKNVFTLLLIFLGFISSIYNLIRLTKKV